MLIICKICSKKFEEEVFPKHPYKEHKITIADYFKKYYNKRDLFTAEPIDFKSIGQYFGTDFINKNNFRNWIKSKSIDTVKDYCINWLAARKEAKNLRYAPSQAELKTLIFPSINYLDDLFKNEGGYYKICDSLGYFNRHERIDKNTNLPRVFEYNHGIHIIKDTREGRPLIFSQKAEVGTLNWGDYALSKPELSGNLRIERKSLNDLIGTLSKSYDRFCREIERAEKDNGYIVILVEEKFSNLLSFNFLPHVSKRIRAQPEFINHRIRDILQKFDKIQLLCVDGRKEAARITARIFQLGNKARETDLQLAVDLGIL